MLRLIMLVVSALILSGCSNNATIRNAWAEKSQGNNVIIHVGISANDAEFIKRNQVYFSIVLNECSGNGKRFPMEPMIGGKRASDFDFNISNRSETDVVAVGPAWVIKGYHEPCVLLEGGGYVGARLKSKQAPLVMRGAH
ncbi:hypothetical protein [Novosphingobium sp. Fuku2-ISO-50]|uniref:hypothetical protein n=1 Tax=Novosphingobium sp. Fuku2-ISO-50 TaxID=1739114 RepID=UPI0018D2114A|nr:hypothetical protein [Novosphingobium sp. Fuku2-ISO-50]